MSPSMKHLYLQIFGVPTIKKFYPYFDGQCMVWSMALEHTSTLLVGCLRWNQEVALASSSDGQCCWAALICLVRNSDCLWNNFLQNIMGTLTI